MAAHLMAPPELRGKLADAIRINVVFVFVVIGGATTCARVGRPPSSRRLA